MTKANEVLARAASRIGYRAANDPNPGSEAGRYMADKMKQNWLRGPSKSIWWCMCFVSMCFDEVGEINAIGGLSYNCQNTKKRNIGNIVTVAKAKPGDVVMFDWGGDGVCDHVGIVEKNLGKGRLQTIEGNVSNSVKRCVRKAAINCVIRPNWSAGSTIKKPATKESKTVDQKLVVDGVFGPATYTRWQKVLNTPVDGVKSWPSEMIKATQRYLNKNVPSESIQQLTGFPELMVDGYDGQKTWRVFQYLIWCHRPDIVKRYAPVFNFWDYVDGLCGVVTKKTVQHLLNDAKIGSGVLG